MFCEHNTPKKNFLNLGIVEPAPLNEHSFCLKKIKTLKLSYIPPISLYISGSSNTFQTHAHIYKNTLVQVHWNKHTKTPTTKKFFK